MHFEFKWWRVLTRVGDIVKEYGPNTRDTLKEVALKYNTDPRARDAWTAYASYDEDMKLRNAKEWSAKYNGMRYVFWDMTTVPGYEFSHPDLNRITYSKCYAKNCVKGGISNQLCGWIKNKDLWTGEVGDTEYN